MPNLQEVLVYRVPLPGQLLLAVHAQDLENEKSTKCKLRLLAEILNFGQ